MPDLLKLSRPKLQVAYRYPTSTKSPTALKGDGKHYVPFYDAAEVAGAEFPLDDEEEKDFDLRYTGSTSIGGNKVYHLARKKVPETGVLLKGRGHFDTYRFMRFGDKYREVNSKGKPVDRTTDKLKKGWSGIVVEAIDPDSSKPVKYRQYPVKSDEEDEELQPALSPVSRSRKPMSPFYEPFKATR